MHEKKSGFPNENRPPVGNLSLAEEQITGEMRIFVLK